MTGYLPKAKSFLPETLVIEYDNGTKLLVPYLDRDLAQQFIKDEQATGRSITKYYVTSYDSGMEL